MAEKVTFNLLNQDSEPVSSDQFSGRNLIMFFYPGRDDTGVHSGVV